MKKTVSLLLAALLLLSLDGCALYDGEYYTETPYTAQEETQEDSGRITSAELLEAALTRLVETHSTGAKLSFGRYDGDVSTDLAQTCWHVSTETALGAYCVDYISYDLSRVSAYYEASVYIAYSRTREQVDSLLRLRNSYGIRECIQSAIENGETYLAIQVTTAFVDADVVEDYARELYYALGSCVSCPSCTVEAYPASGLERIFEITIDYGMTEEESAQRLREQRQRCILIASQLEPGDGAETAAALARTLSADCICVTDSTDPMDATAWSALCRGQADSEGFAMAYMALCRRAGVECQVVCGQYQKQTHWWNIVRLEGEYYHMDVSLYPTLGEAAVLLRSDETMDRDYWWAVEDYPACTGTLTPAMQEETAEDAEK